MGGTAKPVRGCSKTNPGLKQFFCLYLAFHSSFLNATIFRFYLYFSVWSGLFKLIFILCKLQHAHSGITRLFNCDGWCGI